MTYESPDPARGDAGAAPETQAPRRGLGCALEIIETLVLTLLIYLLIHNFIAQPFEVEQTSMYPTIVQGQYVLIDKISPHFSDYQRGDIIVFNPPDGYSEGGVPFIKRVIGLPGDTIRLDNGNVYVTPAGGSAVRLEEPYVATDVSGALEPTLPRNPDGTSEWVVPTDSYFVMGDHRSVSQDSRVFGPISRDLIIGRALLRYFPLDKLGIFTRPTYAGLSGAPGSGAPESSPGARLPAPLAAPAGQAFAGSSAITHGSIARS
jgi:signal peptidase I